MLLINAVSGVHLTRLNPNINFIEELVKPLIALCTGNEGMMRAKYQAVWQIT